MEENDPHLEEMIEAPDFDPERLGARFWFEQYLKQREQNQQLQQQLEQVQQQVVQLQEALDKLKQRTSQNSSQPPSQDGYKKANRSKQGLRKLGPKYGHEGSTRNGEGWVDHQRKLPVSECPECGANVERVADAPVQRQQVAELVNKPVEVWEYKRPSHWGAQLVTMMFSFLETMRLQGKNAVAELFNLLAILERSGPPLQST